jgi:starch phosphorylase
METPLQDIDSNKLVADITSGNKFGVFFGVSQKTLDSVWNNLTDPAGNSIAYISMEIGADLDVYNPVKDFLLTNKISSSKKAALKYHIKKFLNGPEKIPNYGGGLGILAGDTLKSFADCKIPSIGISLLYRKGYFSQLVDSMAGQVAWATNWRPEETPSLYQLKDPNTPDMPLQIEIPFFDRGDRRTIAYANLWLKMEINSDLDFFVPEILLDYSVASSPDWIRDAAQHLYESRSERSKVIQRRLLGAGIIPVMQALNITSQTIHLNEQHGVVVVLHLIAQYLKDKFGEDYPLLASDKDIILASEKAAEKIIFTIHTPIKAGHDRFDKNLYADFSHSFCRRMLELLAKDEEAPDYFNFTSLAMKINRGANSVSRLHKSVTRQQFPKYADKIKAITNGVHHLTWISNAKAELYDSFAELKNWRHNPSIFANASKLLENQKFRTYLEQAWHADTTILIQYINSMLTLHRGQMHETWIDPPNFMSHLDEKDRKLSPDDFTIGFARRFSTYKRADLIFENIDTLCKIIVDNSFPVNFVFAGKAHPSDEPGKSLLKLVLDTQKELYEKSQGLAKLIFIPGYDMAIAKMMVAGVHAWLNSPKRPLEASGTSGMKAALNAVPNISTMDGWWVEGYHRGKTGWKFGVETLVGEASLCEDYTALSYKEDSASFYQVFPKILTAFYDINKRAEYIDKCIMNIALNGPIFNTHRMASEYVDLYGLSLSDSMNRKIAKFREMYNSDR